MAENKKSVVLYCDIIHTVEKLDNETAGQLFKYYLQYVNDMNPETDNILVEVAFEPIRQSLKRDLKKWAKRAETSRLNGQKGGRPKKNPDGIDNTQGTQRDKQIPREPVSGSVSVNDSVNVTDNEINKECVSKAIVINEIFEFYNACATECELPKAIKLTSTRKSHMAARLKEYDEDVFKVVIQKARRSKFLNGIGKSDFKASFDWIIKSANFQKILEGNYDNKEDVFEKLIREEDEASN